MVKCFRQARLRLCAYTATCFAVALGQQGSAARGTIEVTYVNGAKKAVPPEHLGTFVRKFLWLNLTTQSDVCAKHVRQVAVCNSAEFQSFETYPRPLAKGLSNNDI